MSNSVSPASTSICEGDASAADAEKLANHPIFEGVEPEVVRALVGAFHTQQYRSDTLIVGTAQLQSKLQIVHSGIVELCSVDDKGEEVAVLLLAEKDLVIPAAAVLGDEPLICARALTRVTTLSVDATLMRAAMQSSAPLTFNLMKITSGQWRMAVRAILDLGSRSAAQRLGSFLLRLADISQEQPPILPVAKRHLAARIAVAPETLSRMLQTVADNGLYLRGRAIIIRDRRLIETFCGPDPYPHKDERQLGVFAL